MNIKGLMLVSVFSITLIGCDHPKLRNTFLSLGLIKPIYSDIQYQDEYLDTLFSEIYSLGVENTLIAEEYDWLKYRSELCDNKSSVKVCNDEQNLQHQKKLQSIAVEKLLSVSLDERENNVLTLPDDINTLGMDQPYRFPPQMAYAPKANILAYQSGEGKINIADLTDGSYLRKLEESYRSDSRKQYLQLSENGRLLLTQYNKKIELISTKTGNKLISKEYSGDSYFTKSGRHILLKKNRVIVLLNATDLELTGALLEFPVGHRYMSFNAKTNTIATWGLNTKDVEFYAVNEKDMAFEKISRIVINETARRGRKVDNILLTDDGKYAYAFMVHALFKLNISRGSYYKFLRLPYSSVSQNIILQNNYIITKGYMSTRRGSGAIWDRYVDIIDLAQGKFSFVEQSNLRDSIFLSTPLENTILVGKGLGVQLFKVERDQLAFKTSEQLSPSRKPLKSRSFSNLSKKADESKKNFEKKVRIVSGGVDGIDQALHLGLIRPATDSDIALWKSKNKNHSKILSRTRALNQYIVLKPVRFNGGLAGGHSVVFIAKNSKVAPYGSIGHSIVLYSDTGACKGFLCKN